VIPDFVRHARVGDLLPRRRIASGRTRRIEATAFVIPGAGDLSDYARQLVHHAEDFAAGDGRVVSLESDATVDHRVVNVDRYGQVYDSTSAADPAGLPSIHDIEEWFGFLATACPEWASSTTPDRATGPRSR
jgi:hypothetical protein